MLAGAKKRRAMTGTIGPVKLDVSKVADIERLFAGAVAKFVRRDIAVANAGVELADHPLIAGVSEERSILCSQSITRARSSRSSPRADTSTRAGSFTCGPARRGTRCPA